MQVKSIAECSKGSILQYYRPSLSYQLSLSSFVLSIFEWPFYTDFTEKIKMSPRVICMMLYMDSIVDQTGHFAYAFAHVSVEYSYDVVTIL